MNYSRYKTKQFGFFTLLIKRVLSSFFATLAALCFVASIILVTFMIFGLIDKNDTTHNHVFSLLWILSSIMILSFAGKGIAVLFLSCHLAMNGKNGMNRKKDEGLDDDYSYLNAYLDKIFNYVDFRGVYYFACFDETNISNLKKMTYSKINSRFKYIGLWNYSGYSFRIPREECKTKAKIIDKIKKLILNVDHLVLFIQDFENIGDKDRYIILSQINSSKSCLAFIITNNIGLIDSKSYFHYVFRKPNICISVSDFWNKYLYNYNTAYDIAINYSACTLEKKIDRAYIVGICGFETQKHLTPYKIIDNIISEQNFCKNSDKYSALIIIQAMLSHGNSKKVDLLIRKLKQINNKQDTYGLIARHWIEHIEMERGTGIIVPNSNKESVNLKNKYLKTIADLTKQFDKETCKNAKYFILYNLKHAYSDLFRIVFMQQNHSSELLLNYSNMCKEYFQQLTRMRYNKTRGIEKDNFQNYYRALNIDLFMDFSNRIEQINHKILSLDNGEICAYINTIGNSEHILNFADRRVSSSKSLIGMSMKAIDHYLFNLNLNVNSQAIKQNETILQGARDACDDFINVAVADGEVVDVHLGYAYSVKAKLTLIEFVLKMIVLLEKNPLSAADGKIESDFNKMFDDLINQSFFHYITYKNEYGLKRNKCLKIIKQMALNVLESFNSKGYDYDLLKAFIPLDTKIYNRINSISSQDVFTKISKLKLIVMTLQAFIFYLQ